MDGNRRWAKSKKLDSIEGHKKGIEIAKIIINEAIKKKKSFISLYSHFPQKIGKREPTEIERLNGFIKGIS